MKLSISVLSGIVFAVVGTLHLLRVVYGLDLIVGTTEIPMWVSVVGTAGPGVLAVSNFMHSHKYNK